MGEVSVNIMFSTEGIVFPYDPILGYAKSLRVYCHYSDEVVGEVLLNEDRILSCTFSVPVGKDTGVDMYFVYEDGEELLYVG